MAARRTQLTASASHLPDGEACASPPGFFFFIPLRKATALTSCSRYKIPTTRKRRGYVSSMQSRGGEGQYIGLEFTLFMIAFIVLSCAAFSTETLMNMTFWGSSTPPVSLAKIAAIFCRASSLVAQSRGC